jgi:hypothetical protein
MTSCLGLHTLIVSFDMISTLANWLGLAELLAYVLSRELGTTLNMCGQYLICT